MKLIIIGGGDNTGSVIDLINDNKEGIEIIGISDNHAKGNFINGYPINLIDSEVINYLYESNIIISYARDMKIRRKIYEYFNKHKAKFATLRSQKSYISDSCTIGIGSIIMPGVVIRNQTIIGKNTLINSNATVEHGCQIGNHCHIGPGAVLTGNVTIGNECFIGANSTVLPNIKISEGSIVGAGSVVTKNIPKNEIWFGNPAIKYKGKSGEVQNV